ncbi:BglG family transcription antiterminator [Pediococcus claussenii]|uniref:BglG family transcription antiterminator n=1 Tax=Pediococcus claussenii TaxID=187452 RepID=UPI00081A29BF|nr:PTS sugar transporter subunit IIA [Pediococcus claussenii]ANZ69957.1 hypothetical protein AYR57_06360 [Pediococcus claussenii]ANZ71773.1 hypothetical protein AYR58_06360 [Pediococcus claussenii]
MKFTDRELNLLNLLIMNPTGLKMNELERELGISKRTIFRVFSDIEPELASYTVKINNSDQKYLLMGNGKSLDTLGTEVRLEKSTIQDFTIQQRQNAIAVQLLLANEPIKMQSFALDFHTSNATISKDINALENVFSDYNVNLNRLKSKGISVEGKEFDVRNLAVSIVDSEVNTYEFFKVLASENSLAESQSVTKFFIRILGSAVIRKSYKSIRAYQKTYFKNLSDNSLQRLVIILAVMLRRLEEKQLIQELPPFNHESVLKDQRKTLDIFLKFDSSIKQEISGLEVNYFTLQMQSIDNDYENDADFEKYDLKLSLKVKQLIKMVSEKFNWRFLEDEELYQDLMLIMNNSSVTETREVQKNIEESIEVQNLRSTVRDSIQDSMNVSKLSGWQMEAITNTFITAFSIGVLTRSLSVLVVCPNGIVTAQIIRNQLLQKIPEVGKIKVARTSSLEKMDFDQYDLILSTIDLPGFPIEYRKVSPLLLNEDIESLERFIRTQLVHRKNDVKHELERNENVSFEQFASDVVRSRNLLNAVRIVEVNNIGKSIAEILMMIVGGLSKEIVSDTNEVVGKLLHRLAQSPVGIPNSELGLIHTTSKYVENNFCSIYQLQDPIEFQAIGGEKINLKRIVLLLGKFEMTGLENQIISSISTTVIESDSNIKTFEQGNQTEIRQTIGSKFVQILKSEG